MSLTPRRTGNTNMCVNDPYGTVLKTATNTTLTIVALPMYVATVQENLCLSLTSWNSHSHSRMGLLVHLCRRRKGSTWRKSYRTVPEWYIILAQIKSSYPPVHEGRHVYNNKRSEVVGWEAAYQVSTVLGLLPKKGESSFWGSQSSSCSTCFGEWVHSLCHIIYYLFLHNCTVLYLTHYTCSFTLQGIWFPVRKEGTQSCVCLLRVHHQKKCKKKSLAVGRKKVVLLKCFC
jgi:hypothetical protein